jgi:hypothetical protein
LIDFLVLKIAIHDHHQTGWIKNHKVYCYIHRLFPIHVNPKVNESFLRGDVADGNWGVANKSFKDRREALNVIRAALASRD